ncbi:hypothetical protein L2E82_16201 [Cichorium intybus]|uniref:Uncharacterized protein n=1 Tax=Cichorium intybus TaxID=13427 RepID=A0ACB9F5E6_CICIN|nr:hypothetical protein L2E82_16201 [Cichorium intybus]
MDGQRFSGEVTRDLQEFNPTDDDREEESSDGDNDGGSFVDESDFSIKDSGDEIEPPTMFNNNVPEDDRDFVDSDRIDDNGANGNDAGMVSLHQIEDEKSESPNNELPPVSAVPFTEMSYFDEGGNLSRINGDNLQIRSKCVSDNGPNSPNKSSNQQKRKVNKPQIGSDSREVSLSSGINRASVHSSSSSSEEIRKTIQVGREIGYQLQEDDETIRVMVNGEGDAYGSNWVVATQDHAPDIRLLRKFKALKVAIRSWRSASRSKEYEEYEKLVKWVDEIELMAESRLLSTQECDNRRKWKSRIGEIDNVLVGSNGAGKDYSEMVLRKVSCWGFRVF